MTVCETGCVPLNCCLSLLFEEKLKLITASSRKPLHPIILISVELLNFYFPEKSYAGVMWGDGLGTEVFKKIVKQGNF